MYIMARDSVHTQKWFLNTVVSLLRVVKVHGDSYRYTVTVEKNNGFKIKIILQGINYALTHAGGGHARRPSLVLRSACRVTVQIGRV